MNSTQTQTQTVTLNNGIKMPRLGLGVFLSTPEQTVDAVRTAIDGGYRMVDTASAYLNERAVGEGLRAAGIDRDEMFITTKAFPSEYGFDSILRGFDMSLQRLGLEHLDLYLLHWPVPTEFERTLDAWRAAEKLLADGRVRAIGVSNFTADHLDRLIAGSNVVPAVNQVELHPFFIQAGLRAAGREHGIVTEAWSPIGGVYNRSESPIVKDGASSPLTHPVVTELAEQYGKSPAQIVLRWHIEHDVVVIPKSVHANRIAENADVFDFALTAEEVAAIDALDTGVRAGADPETFDENTYPVDIDAQ